ncbi:unnamed protein product [Fraxinus pennsylvanica]|uniref:Myb-like domain-containing protein n=1 Tax=Fraxinus pennsylvanica TaxID=56036 RepID=A0AAD1YPM4_9LAMI|nr:unnamed protein product [Fraxinus pennsylvanica]
MANQGENNVMMRDYRKGNWTVQETMVLIEAKKMDDERRMKSERGKPAELRWKWVEDYCWRKGCLRSQNQCNDKWDNLMRDFKKVREYERRVAGGGELSYWRIEKSDRKDKKLPSNMLPQIYDALVEVVEKKGLTAAATGGSNANATVVGLPSGLGQPSMPRVMQNPMPAPTVLLPLPPTAQPTILRYSQPLPAAGSDTTEYSDSPSKRRRRRGEGSSGGSLHEVGSAISKSAFIIAEAIRSNEEREERRHREVLSLHRRRLQIEESKAEINRQGISGLVEAVNKLADSIHSLASHKSN